MKVRDLIQKLMEVDPESDVLVPAFDHSYVMAHMEVCRYRREDPNHFTECYGDASDVGPSLPCVVFSM